MILPVIDNLSALPVFMPDHGAFLPFFMLDVCVVVVMVLGNGDGAREAR
jgi:hypothetical protein